MEKAIRGWHEVRGASKEELEDAKAEVYRKYGDIIRLPHPTSKNHKPMSPEKRAAQFAPFAALTGYGDEIDEAGRLTDEKKIPGEDAEGEIDQCLAWMREKLRRKEAVRARIVYYVPDGRKAGGKYYTETVTVKRIDDYNGEILSDAGKRIRIKDISDISAFPF